MIKWISTVVCALLATTLLGGSHKMKCRKTGQTMDECCCEMNAGKFYCKLTKKTYDECCCDM
jgi:hypothetical protein